MYMAWSVIYQVKMCYVNVECMIAIPCIIPISHYIPYTYNGEAEQEHVVCQVPGVQHDGSVL